MATELVTLTSLYWQIRKRAKHCRRYSSEEENEGWVAPWFLLCSRHGDLPVKLSGLSISWRLRNSPNHRKAELGLIAFCPFLAWRITTKVRDKVASGISAQTLRWPIRELGWDWLGWESGKEFRLEGQGFCLAIIFFFPGVLDIWRFFFMLFP